TKSIGWPDCGSALQRVAGPGETFDWRAAHLLHYHGRCRARNAPGKRPDGRGPHQVYGSHDRTSLNFEGKNLGRIRGAILAAVVAMALSTAPRSAKPAMASLSPQKACGTVTVAAAS